MEQPYSKITEKIKISPDKVSEVRERIKDILGFKKEMEKFLSQKIIETTKIIEIIMLGGINLKSSDIHIEPEENQAKIRIRLDGMLRDLVGVPQKPYQSLLSRIKLISGIKLNIKDRAQDGRFSLVLEEITEKNIVSKLVIEVRVSAVPTEHGESVVLRILNPKSLVEIEKLGLRKDLLAIFEKEIKKPNGMIVVTGPTGSGKTTTLYGFLKKIQRPEIKIITIEDPIEYVFIEDRSLIDQREVYLDTLSFARALRATFRQDPDVIMVGEMRDAETMATAITAAETGHLVFATLHTNSASQSIHRIIDSFPADQQGQIRAQLSGSLLGVVSQRLIPRIKGGLIPACEIMFSSLAVANLIRENKIHELPLVIETSGEKGMISLNRALADLVKRKEISLENALNYSLSPVELKMLVR